MYIPRNFLYYLVKKHAKNAFVAVAVLLMSALVLLYYMLLNGSYRLFGSTALTKDVTPLKELNMKLLNFTDRTRGNLAEDQLEASILHIGNRANIMLSLESLISQDRAQRKLRIGFIGGSNSCHTNFTCGPMEDMREQDKKYFDFLHDWLAPVFNDSLGIKVEIIYGALWARNSDYFAKCIQVHLDLDKLDMLLIELAMNDYRTSIVGHPGFRPDPGMPMEDLIRVVKRKNHRVHIVLINIPDLSALLGNRCKATANLPFKDRCEQQTEVNEHLQLAKYYNITSIHWNHLICHLDMDYVTKQKVYHSNAGPDRFHAGFKVHRQLALFVVHYFRKYVVEPLLVTTHPLPDDHDSFSLRKPLYKSTKDARYLCFPAKSELPSDPGSNMTFTVNSTSEPGDCDFLPNIMVAYTACSEFWSNRLDHPKVTCVRLNDSVTVNVVYQTVRLSTGRRVEIAVSSTLTNAFNDMHHIVVQPAFVEKIPLPHVGVTENQIMLSQITVRFTRLDGPNVFDLENIIVSHNQCAES